MIPTCADLERYGDWDCIHDRFEYARDQRLILQKGRTTQLPANFFCGTPHVEVDDLRAEIYVDARGFCELVGLGASELDDAWLGLAFVAHPQPRFRRTPQPRVRGEHLGRCKARAKLATQDPKWTVRHAGHGRKHRGGGQDVGSDVHGR